MNPAHIIYAIAAISLISGVFVAIAMLLAPEGYEDETGYHHGDKE